MKHATHGIFDDPENGCIAQRRLVEELQHGSQSGKREIEHGSERPALGTNKAADPAGIAMKGGIAYARSGSTQRSIFHNARRMTTWSNSITVPATICAPISTFEVSCIFSGTCISSSSCRSCCVGALVDISTPSWFSLVSVAIVIN